MSTDPGMAAEPSAEPTAPVSEPTATPAPAPSAPSVRWSDGFAPDIRDHPITQRLEDPEAGIRELIGAQKLIGADKIALLNENSTPEEQNAFFTKLGRPAKVEDYDLSGVSVPEGLPLDADFQSSMVEKMHARGASQEMVAGILNDYYESVGGQFQAMQVDTAQAREASEKELRNEGGKSYDANVDLANRALVAGAGGDEAILQLKMADGGTLGANPDVIRVFAALGGKMNEHGLVGAKSSTSIMSRPEAEAKRNSHFADQEFMDKYLHKEHPQHDWAVQQITDLTEMQFPPEE